MEKEELTLDILLDQIASRKNQLEAALLKLDENIKTISGQITALEQIENTIKQGKEHGKDLQLEQGEVSEKPTDTATACSCADRDCDCTGTPVQRDD
jgi:predicted  nucleic acid-binding Zn-ribbon protein